jgi:hypothetical protein
MEPVRGEAHRDPMMLSRDFRICLRRGIAFGMALASVAAIGLSDPSQAKAQDAQKPGTSRPPLVWFGPRPDFMALFENDSAWRSGETQWSDAARRIRIVKFSTQFLEAVPDETLSRIVRGLASKHIAIGLESLAQNWFHETPECGHGVEGYADPGSANKIVAKLKRVGGSLTYIAMDEPLWFGHYYSGKNACHSTIADVAERVSVIIKIYTAAFPDVVVGDTEPFPAVSSQPGWAADYASWTKAFKAATGIRLSFLHMDFNWGDPRLNAPTASAAPNPDAIANLAKQVVAVARANGQQVGMIYNGNDTATTDQLWMDQARTHVRYIAASKAHPDQALFETWAKHPTRALPETDPNALANLVGYYLQHE